MTAPVAEVFSSVQGEGPLVGVRQVFVRTYGCDLGCLYCDTPASRAESGPLRFERPPGSREWREYPNPVSAEFVWGLIRELGHPGGLHHSVSFTGGEPLLHAEFVRRLAGLCQRAGLGTYLETNGQQVEALRGVLGVIDVISIDVKLPSSQPPETSALAAEGLLPRSMEFLRLALHGGGAWGARGPRVTVKVVVTADVAEAEIEEVARAVAAESREVTLVLQPVTPRGAVISAPEPRQMLGLQAAAAAHLRDVRVIPQCHPPMGQL